MKIVYLFAALHITLVFAGCSSDDCRTKVESAPPQIVAEKAMPQLVNGDLPPIKETANSIVYDKSVLPHRDFDGAYTDSWIRNKEKMCRNGKARPIIVDVDKTAISGNFLRDVEVREVARAALNRFEEKYGVVFLTANFAVDRIVAFFSKHNYPAQAPVVARPRNYWGSDYDSWCNQNAAFATCEFAYKADRIDYIRSQCEQEPERMVGLGDKFSDYYAYQKSGVCPMIVSEGNVTEANREARAQGCQLDRSGDFAWLDAAKAYGERCALIPEKYILPWAKVEETMEKYLAGKIECGAW